MIVILAFFMSNTNTAMGQDEDSRTQFYCRISPRHTMCRFTDTDLGPNCVDFGYVEGRDIGQFEKDIILDLHNSLRAKIANGEGIEGIDGKPIYAADMTELVWDNELAEIAQRWANQCTIDTDEQRDVEDFEVGQNINSYWPLEGTNPSDEEILAQLFQPWADEIKLYNTSIPYSSQDASDAASFTQLVWSNTRKIGCGMVSIAKESVLGRLLVCNYGSKGNLDGMDLYNPGPTCTDCPFTWCSLKYPGICSPISILHPNSRNKLPRFF